VRRYALAITLGLAAVVAGCGSASPSTPAGAAPAAGGTSGSTSSIGGTALPAGSAGMAGPSASANYSATNAAVLRHIESYLVKYFAAKGFTGVSSACFASHPASPTCTVAGTNSSGSRSSDDLTLAVNQTTGALRITGVVANATTSGLSAVGAVGTLGPPPSSGTYSTSNPTVLQHIDALVASFLTARGFAAVSVDCQPVNAAAVECSGSGSGSSGREAIELSVSVDPTSGALRVTHSQSISSSPSGVTVGPAGTIEPASQGQYSAADHTVLQQVANTLERFFAARGFSKIQISCMGVNPAIAFCQFAGTPSSRQRSSAVVTIELNRKSGALRIVHVS